MPDPTHANPYAPPATDTAAPIIGGHRYVPLRARVNAATVALGFWVVMQLLWSLGTLAGALMPMSELEALPDDELPQRALVTILVVLVWVLGLVASVITTAFSLPHANRNARVLAEGVQFSPGSTVWSFFVPVLNLFRPYQALTELWRSSEPKAIERWTFGPSHWTLPAWWATWIAATVLERVESKIWEVDVGPSSLLFVAAAVLWISILRRLASRQEERLQVLLRAGKLAPIR